MTRLKQSDVRVEHLADIVRVAVKRGKAVTVLVLDEPDKIHIYTNAEHDSGTITMLEFALDEMRTRQ